MPTLKASAATAEIAVPESIRPLLEAPLRASALLIEGDVPVCIVSCDVLGLARDLTDENDCLSAQVGSGCEVGVIRKRCLIRFQDDCLDVRSTDGRMWRSLIQSS